MQFTYPLTWSCDVYRWNVQNVGLFARVYASKRCLFWDPYEEKSELINV